MFDSVAKHYDRINKYMSLGLDKQWREFLVENLQVWGRSDGLALLPLFVGPSPLSEWPGS
jgi:ubiquinone/menaquinone biosynthesis C-methylase UbiE